MGGCFNFKLPSWLRFTRSPRQRNTRNPVRVVPRVPQPSPSPDRQYSGTRLLQVLYRGKRTKLQAFEVLDEELPRKAGRIEVSSFEEILQRHLLLIAADEGNRSVWASELKLTTGTTVREHFYRKCQRRSERYEKYQEITKLRKLLMEFGRYQLKLGLECMREIQVWLDAISDCDGNIMIRTLVSDDPDDVDFREWQASHGWARRVPTKGSSTPEELKQLSELVVPETAAEIVVSEEQGSLEKGKISADSVPMDIVHAVVPDDAAAEVQIAAETDEETRDNGVSPAVPDDAAAEVQIAAETDEETRDNGVSAAVPADEAPTIEVEISAPEDSSEAVPEDDARKADMGKDLERIENGNGDGLKPTFDNLLDQMLAQLAEMVKADEERDGAKKSTTEEVPVPEQHDDGQTPTASFMQQKCMGTSDSPRCWFCRYLKRQRLSKKA